MFNPSSYILQEACVWTRGLLGPAEEMGEMTRKV